ncbi:hypothetical protein [Sphingomonas sp.]|uniref:hypothetical protein n=1 Tax=Sphingomonas sp. TaxID=28214 RepID=UPI002DBF26B6|nr:hypothetical protein [Sphingomonas sp.]HEU4967811.1 hypothetical protein [Sphingomonas sp.]
MFGSPVTPFLLIAIVSLVLLLALLYAAKRAWIGGRPAGAIAVLIVLVAASSTIIMPALPTVDNALGDGIPLDNH